MFDFNLTEWPSNIDCHMYHTNFLLTCKHRVAILFYKILSIHSCVLPLGLAPETVRLRLQVLAGVLKPSLITVGSNSNFLFAYKILQTINLYRFTSPTNKVWYHPWRCPKPCFNKEQHFHNAKWNYNSMDWHKQYHHPESVVGCFLYIENSVRLSSNISSQVGSSPLLSWILLTCYLSTHCIFYKSVIIGQITSWVEIMNCQNLFPGKIHGP